MASKKAADIVELDEERRRRAQENLPEDDTVSAESAADETDENAAEAADVENSETEAEIVNEQAAPSASAAPVEETVVAEPSDAADDTPPEEFETAGAMLAAARHALGYSLQDVSARTNLTVERLRALEAMEISALPTAPFTLGFVRTYAQVLNLPAEPMMARFRAEANFGERGRTPVLNPKLQNDLGPRPQISLLAVIVVIGFMLWIGWRMIEALAPEQTVPMAQFPLEPGVVAPEQESYEVGTSLEDSVPMVPDSDPTQISLPQVIDTVGPSNDPIVITREEVASDDPLAILSDSEEDASAAAPSDTDGTELDAGEPVTTVETPEPATPAPTPSTAEQLTRSRNSEDGPAIEGGVVGQPAEGLVTVEEDAGQDTEPALTEEAETAERRTPVVTKPVLRVAVEPVYPVRCQTGAADREIVTIAFTVSRYGKVTNSQVQDSTNSCFNRSALSAIARWDFEPATSDGRAVASEVRTTRVIFQHP
ncbi:TonB family protein [Parvularcula sp. LCG005]|uniref:TonB family protein n=1 Tax=Parvularcula sp. LCG005 TaxID=3078805 RepID=UPI002942ED8C|nr:TonB family protein [Parvularcula sp. LCG005]WOI52008.1 TonB family protein [Parvularcula sp. LCG005]